MQHKKIALNSTQMTTVSGGDGGFTIIFIVGAFTLIVGGPGMFAEISK